MFGLVAVSLLSTVLLSAASAPSEPHFVETKTRAVLDDGAVVVSFKEAGLAPNRPVEVQVAVDATTVSECVTGGPSPRSVFTTSSSASARQTSTYTADAKGKVTGSSRLVARPGRVEVSGLGCTMRVTTEFVVTLRDRTHDVTYVVPSPGN